MALIDSLACFRGPQRVIDGRGTMFYCQILPGMEVELMRSTDLIGDTRAALPAAVAGVGGTASGALMFNCILRRLELDARGLSEAFVGAIADIPTAGFHTYGESWLGHINQTLTGIMFGRRHDPGRAPSRPPPGRRSNSSSNGPARRQRCPFR
jgi:hypothetical protein